LLGTALISAPWITLSLICVLYLVGIPLSVRSYSRVRQQAAARVQSSSY